MPKRKRESLIQGDLIDFLRHREWLVEPTHGNLVQKGFPDLYCHHVRWEYRWIDVKVEGQYQFTKWQKLKWPNWEKHGVGIWILTGAHEYQKLFRPPNWRDYWKESYGELPDIKELLREIANRD